MPWLESEIRVVKPEIVVCLGATAAQALIGKAFTATEHHGEILPWQPVPNIMATVHIGQAFWLEGTIDFLINTVFNYPTLAECYKVAALAGVNRLNFAQSSAAV